MSDPLKGAKVGKTHKGEKVPAGPETPHAEQDATEDVTAPAAEDESALTAKERAEAAPELPPVELPELKIPPTYLVRKGGRAWYRGQQIKFNDGEVFTSETWDELAIAGFRECGVTIELLAG
jgi:hypothetical protein